jgi:cation diffusion facilitator family transporter
MNADSRAQVDTETAARDSYWLRPLVCTAVGLVGNLLLTLGKIIVGYLAHSTALVADGFHSLADVASDFGIILALKTSERPPDENHPYGHHGFETLGAIGVAVFMLFTGFWIGKEAVVRLLGGEFTQPTLPAFLVSLGAVLIKEGMARYTIIAGRLHNSPALLANGAMHRSDAISSLAAAMGILGALLGVPSLDTIAALIIALFILRMGWQLSTTNIMALMDTSPNRSLVEAMEATAEQVDGVQAIRKIKVRQRGSYYLADLWVAIPPDHTIVSAHTIADAIEAELQNTFPHIVQVLVHVEPGAETPAADDHTNG